MRFVPKLSEFQRVKNVRPPPPRVLELAQARDQALLQACTCVERGRACCSSTHSPCQQAAIRKGKSCSRLKRTRTRNGNGVRNREKLYRTRELQEQTLIARMVNCDKKEGGEPRSRPCWLHAAGGRGGKAEGTGEGGNEGRGEARVRDCRCSVVARSVLNGWVETDELF